MCDGLPRAVRGVDFEPRKGVALIFDDSCKGSDRATPPAEQLGQHWAEVDAVPLEDVVGAGISAIEVDDRGIDPCPGFVQDGGTRFSVETVDGGAEDEPVRPGCSG